jgi:hypothetical protein
MEPPSAASKTMHQDRNSASQNKIRGENMPKKSENHFVNYQVWQASVIPVLDSHHSKYGGHQQGTGRNRPRRRHIPAWLFVPPTTVSQKVIAAFKNQKDLCLSLLAEIPAETIQTCCPLLRGRVHDIMKPNWLILTAGCCLLVGLACLAHFFVAPKSVS